MTHLGAWPVNLFSIHLICCSKLRTGPVGLTCSTWLATLLEDTKIIFNHIDFLEELCSYLSVPNESTMKMVPLGPIKKKVSKFSFLELFGFPVVNFIQCQNNRQTYTIIIICFFKTSRYISEHFSDKRFGLLKNPLPGVPSTKKKKESVW